MDINRHPGDATKDPEERFRCHISAPRAPRTWAGLEQHPVAQP
jgi:hypothetical protein